MDYKKIITIPTWKRPEYTGQVLEGMKRCYGIEDYTIYIFAEPEYPEVIDVIESFTDLNIVLSINEKRLGLPGNTRQCLDKGFSMTDYLIHFEDDIVPSKDCLKYFEWARDKYVDDKNIFSISGLHRTHNFKNKDDLYHAVIRIDGFIPTGWAMWQDRWKETKLNWEETKTSWSLSAHNARKRSCVLIPYLSRTKYIGIENTTNCTPEFHKEHHCNEFWVDSVDFDDNTNEYHEIPYITGDKNEL